MPTGASALMKVDQEDIPLALESDNSYFLIKLYDTQVFFPAGLFSVPESVLLSSTVESSFYPRQPITSVYRSAHLRKNSAAHLGIHTKLTDWLPVRAGDSVRVALSLAVVKDKPFEKLIEQLDRVDLSAVLSLGGPEWTVALKVARLTGQLLDYFSGAGLTQPLLELHADFNVSDLETGYYAVIGSNNDEIWPNRVRFTGSHQLCDPTGHLLSRLSYAVFQVQALSRLGPETARDEPWWEVLCAGKEGAIAELETGITPEKVLRDWRVLLLNVRRMARTTRKFISTEVDSLILSAHAEIGQHLSDPLNLQGTAAELDPEWQKVLRVRTHQELQRIVSDYQRAVDASRRLQNHTDQ